MSVCWLQERSPTSSIRRKEIVSTCWMCSADCNLIVGLHGRMRSLGGGGISRRHLYVSLCPTDCFRSLYVLIFLFGHVVVQRATRPQELRWFWCCCRWSYDSNCDFDVGVHNDNNNNIVIIIIIIVIITIIMLMTMMLLTSEQNKRSDDKTPCSQTSSLLTRNTSRRIITTCVQPAALSFARNTRAHVHTHAGARTYINVNPSCTCSLIKDM